MKGRAVITGADGGMGMEITRAVASAGYEVIMLCYDAQSGIACRNKIVKETGNDPYVGILHHDEGVDLIPSNLELSAMEFNLVNAMSREISLKTYLNEVKHKYDYVLIDCMPSLGMITINALSAADSVIIPVQAQYLPA